MVLVLKAPEIWAQALETLRAEVSPANFHIWLKDTYGVSFSQGEFIVGAPGASSAEWVDRRFRSLIEEVLGRILNQPVRIRLQGGVKEGGEQPSHPLFNPKYTFHSFVVGDENRLAYSASQKVAEAPGKVFNPLFLFSHPGMGKTHLLHAIGNSLFPGELQVLYATAEQFTYDFVTSLQGQNRNSFRAHYRQRDVLLIDDIQFLSGKKETLKGFSQLLDYYSSSQRQLVLTCDRPLRDLGWEEKLASRLQSGLLTPLAPPTQGTKLAILKAKSQEKGIELSPEVAEAIVTSTGSDCRELEGALNLVLAYSSCLQKPLTLDTAQAALANLPIKGKALPSADMIIRSVCRLFNLTPEDLKGSSRSRQVAQARSIAVYFLREEGGLTFSQISFVLGGKTSAAYFWKKIKRELEEDKDLRNTIFDLKKDLS